jgi:exodeoxyribonuclease-5
LDGIGTIIVDEAGMIDNLLLQHLLSFNIPILFVGDHGQLEPIGTNSNLMKSPDVRLENIHRQARDNPILQLATAFREGRKVSSWSDPRGRLEIVPKHAFDRRISPKAQIICGYNRTRHGINQRVREMLGIAEYIVAPGERLICLRNNKELNLFNGQQLTAEDVGPITRRTIFLKIRTDDNRLMTLECLTEQFGQNLVVDFCSQDVVLMDYGYCLTTHKAVGSEWNVVQVVEEVASQWDARRWRYTAATRARERLVYFQ